MPSQFQPYYPRRPSQPVTKTALSPAAGQQAAGLPIDKLIQAIQQQRAAQQMATQPDNLGTLGDEALIAQINQSPSAMDNLGVLGDESLIQQTPGSYY